MNPKKEKLSPEQIEIRDLKSQLRSSRLRAEELYRDLLTCDRRRHELQAVVDICGVGRVDDVPAERNLRQITLRVDQTALQMQRRPEEMLHHLLQDIGRHFIKDWFSPALGRRERDKFVGDEMERVAMASGQRGGILCLEYDQRQWTLRTDAGRIEGDSFCQVVQTAHDAVFPPRHLTNT